MGRGVWTAKMYSRVSIQIPRTVGKIEVCTKGIYEDKNFVKTVNNYLIIRQIKFKLVYAKAIS